MRTLLPCTSSVAGGLRAGRQARHARRRTSQPTADKAATAPTKTALPPLPAEMRTRSSPSRLDGKTLKYTVTVGALPVRDKDGKVAGEVVVTAYTVEGDNRPVTFALQWRAGRFERLSELWRHRAQAFRRPAMKATARPIRPC